MKYDALLLSVSRRVRDDVYSGRMGLPGKYDAAAAALFDAVAERRPFDESLADLAQRVEKLILRWDVRMVASLRDKFPEHFPQRFRAGPLVADYDEAGDWVIEVPQ